MRSVVSVVLGIASALLTSVVVHAMGWWPQTVEPASAQQSDREIRTVIRERVDADQLSALKREIEELKSQQASADVGEEEAVEPPSPEEERAELRARFAQLASTHQMQRVDVAWAPSAEANLAKGLDSLAEQAGFDVLEMECKTSSCRVDMRFASFDAARTNTEALVHNVYPGLNCARHMYASEPGDPTDSYEAALYLDCSLQRAGQVLPPE